MPGIVVAVCCIAVVNKTSRQGKAIAVLLIAYKQAASNTEDTIG